MDGGREEMRSISAYWRMAWVGLLLVVGLVAAPTPTVSAADRVALVVGNVDHAGVRGQIEAGTARTRRRCWPIWRSPWS